ncbi:MAG: hypothetical protein ACE5Q6_25375 [Dehalococcoidia bacterium]
MHQRQGDPRVQVTPGPVKGYEVLAVGIRSDARGMALYSSPGISPIMTNIGRLADHHDC